MELESYVDVNINGGYAAYGYDPADQPVIAPKFRVRVPVPQQLSGFFAAEPGTELRLFQDVLSKEFENVNVPRDRLPALHAACTTYRDITANYEPYRRWMLYAQTRDLISWPASTK